MKKTVLFYLLFLFFTLSFSQNSYTIGNETLELTTEVEGKIDLLWTITNGQYRYFIRTEDGKFTELKNTKNSDNKYTESYKNTLKTLTATSGLSTDKVKLTTYSLKRFVDRYNKSVDINYNAVDKDSKVNFRLGIFGGITNHSFVSNIENSSYPQLAAELEIFGDTSNPRHGGIFQIRQTLASDGDYKTTELSLGYRLRVFKKDRFNIFVQNKFATLNFFSFDLPAAVANDTGVLTASDTQFDVPFIFGIGADIKISDNSYISIIYDSLFAVNLENNGNFSTDILIGYKLNL